MLDDLTMHAFRKLYSFQWILSIRVITGLYIYEFLGSFIFRMLIIFVVPVALAEWVRSGGYYEWKLTTRRTVVSQLATLLVSYSWHNLDCAAIKQVRCAHEECKTRRCINIRCIPLGRIFHVDINGVLREWLSALTIVRDPVYRLGV